MATTGALDSVSSSAANTLATTSTTAGGDLGKEAFLQLLVTQMQNQDPLNPAEDTEFISQLATFSTLEQLQNMNESMELTQAAAMIGKDVTWMESDEAGNVYTFYAPVQAMRREGGVTYLVIDIDKGKEIKLSDVLMVGEPTTGNGSSAKLSEASTLIGKEVTYFDADDKEMFGVVQSAYTDGSKIYLKLLDSDKKDVIIEYDNVASVKNPSSPAEAEE